MPEFVRWTRVMLQHERAAISGLMAREVAYLTEDARKGFMHDLTDLDHCLSLLDVDQPVGSNCLSELGRQDLVETDAHEHESRPERAE